MENYEELISLLKNSKNCVVLTGAGISTLSGIPDFRSNNGIYKKFDGEKLFSLEYFNRNPTYFYKNAKEFLYDIENKKPNVIHKVLSELEKMGIVKTIITQNIDTLHQKAGSKKVLEIHGSVGLHYCTKCGKEFSFNFVKKIVDDEEIPYCECGGLIKPKITFYGEMLDEEILQKSIIASSNADSFIILGSSLVVNPAAMLPIYALKNKSKIVIVNKDGTQYDSLAKKYEDLETAFNYLNKNLSKFN